MQANPLVFSMLTTLLLLAGCTSNSEQQSQAAAQDPRYDVVVDLLNQPDYFLYQNYRDNAPAELDTVRTLIREMGQERYKQYEVYSEFETASGVKQVAMLETELDLNDTLLRNAVRDNRFEISDTSVRLIRFDKSELSLQEVHEIAVEDTVYQVFNFYGFAHDGDPIPSHRVFWTRAYGTVFSWYGEQRTNELVGRRPPQDAATILALRNGIRELLILPLIPADSLPQ